MSACVCLFYAIYTDYKHCYNVCPTAECFHNNVWALNVDCRQFFMLSVFLCVVLHDYVIICLYIYGISCLLGFFFSFHHLLFAFDPHSTHLFVSCEWENAWMWQLFCAYASNCVHSILELSVQNMKKKKK